MQIPDYDILRKSGRGAAGEVWIARNRAGSLVALKTIEKSGLAERELVGLRSCARIAECPHLIRIFHIGETDDLLYYTMELADNLEHEPDYLPATLGNRLAREKRLSPEYTVSLGQKLLDGVATLHRNGLIHRDIKPENILFVQGEPKLSDVGLVRPASHSLSFGGTLGFIPPERLKSGSGGKTRTDDLYALGKVLYCCLTGNEVEAYPAFPASLLKREYSHLNEVILTACSRNPALRFQNAEEFSRALTCGVAGKKRLMRRLFRFRHVGIGLAVLLSGIIVWLGLPAPRPAASPGSAADSNGNLSVPDTPPAAEPEAPLRVGEIRNRTYFAMVASTGDPEDETSQTDYDDPVFQQFSPYRLDDAPRRAEIVFRRFSGEEWDSVNSRNFWRNGDTLRGLAHAENGLLLKRQLDDSYAIRFAINFEKLDGSLTFQVAVLNSRGLERTFYRWSFRKNPGKLTLEPLEYQSAGERPIRITPIAQPADSPGFHRVEMVQTPRIFRLYIDDELVLYAPSFFFGGYFTILAGGGESNFFELKNFELLNISRQPDCPPERQYQLPVPPKVAFLRPRP